MLGVLTGFAIITVVIVVGYVLARTEVVPVRANVTLNRVAFFAASPALLFVVLSRADLHVLFSGYIVVAGVSAVIAAAVFIVVSRVLFRMSAADTTIGAASSGYVNANNIGLPVATYVIGDQQFVAPLILVQLLIFAPIILSVLDASTRGRVSAVSVLTGPIRNPIIIGSVLGVVVAATNLDVPDAVMKPLEVLGGAAVPMMLLAFGMSLRGQKPLAPGSQRRAILTASAIKSLGMPVVAFLLAQFALHLPAEQVAAATITAALPSAQNMTNYAVRYDRGVILARDVVLITTIASLPIILTIALLLRGM